MIEGKVIKLVLAIFALYLSQNTLGSDTTGNLPVAVQHNAHAENHSADGHGKFEAGKFMFEHIEDAYEWHILSWKDNHISVPLPVILYSREKGLNIFMSSKLKHGHAEYKGFFISHEPPHENRIVERLGNGEIVAPLDVSVTKNIASLFVGIIIILTIFLSVAKAYNQRPLQAPRGLQSWVEPMIIFVRDEIARPSIGEKKFEKFMPYLLTVFFFIWINNMLGLVPIPPGGANLTGNIAVTMVLALFTFILTTIHGTKVYWGHIFNTPGVPWWLKIPIPLMPFVELIGVFTKPFVLMVRLFANITAGHIIAMGFLSLIFLFGQMNQLFGYGVSVISVFFLIFMTFLELLVAFIQAYVFTFLSAVYFGMAVEEHH
ncbi:MAG: F0F1 ATP synthase subunit A [Bacteroidales bacterium]|nr:F0F1 ATP synthase subunit A [Bacteroidales bacterium]